MTYTVTLKGTIPRMLLDGILGKYFSDSGYGYQKIDIEAPNQEALSNEIDQIKAGTDLKVIGINWPDCPGNHELDEQPCTECKSQTI